MKTMKAAALKEFQTLPGVGKSIADNLWGMGIRSVAELKGREPEELYERLCAYEGARVDRCALYVFRCIVYYVSTKKRRHKLLKWWHWKDRP